METVEAVPQAGQGQQGFVDNMQQQQPMQQQQANMQQPVQQQMPQQQSFQQGGKTGVAAWFDGITFTDVVVLTAILTAAGLSIYYFRQKIKNIQTEYPHVKEEVEKLRMEVDEMRTPAKEATVFGY
jgi:hypothetical protein